MQRSTDSPTLVHATLVALAAFLATGCPPDGPRQIHDTGTDGSDSIGESISLDRFIRGRRTFRKRVYCSALFDCPRKQGALAIQSGFESKSECMNEYDDWLSWSSDEQVAALEEDIDRGWTIYRPRSAADCLQTMRRNSDRYTCEQFISPRDRFDACTDVLEGRRERGRRCVLDLHCRSGNCDPTETRDDTCWGVCDTSYSTVGVGKSCTVGDGQRCDVTNDLMCVPTLDSNGYVCKKRRSVAEGNECEDSQICQGDLSCAPDVCKRIRLGSSGDSCAPSSNQKCEPGLVCRLRDGAESFDDASGTCGTAKSEGDTCYWSFECQENLYCAGGELFPTSGPPRRGTCEVQREPAANCNTPEQCDSYRCIDGTCRKRRFLACNVPN